MRIPIGAGSGARQQKQKARKRSVGGLFITLLYLTTYKKVELGRIELPSKHIPQKLSTCLLLHYLSEIYRNNTHQYIP